MKRNKAFSLILTVAVIAASLSAFLCLPPMTAEAATRTVTTAADTVNASDGETSLREAITAAVAGDTIEFSLPGSGTGTIVLNGEIQFGSKHLTIDGGGGKITLDGRGANRIFNMASTNNTLTLRGITIRNGNSADRGGGVYSSGPVVAQNCTFSGNRAQSSGGGIYTGSILTAEDCIFAGNVSEAETGGGFYARGNVSVTRSIFSDNTAQFGGGGLYSDGLVTAENCTFNDNIAVGVLGVNTYGGGIYAGSTVTAKNCTFYGNVADGDGDSANARYGTGGAIRILSGTANVENCIFTTNVAESWGSAISATNLLAINSIFTGNLIKTGTYGSVNDYTDTGRFYHCTLANNNGSETASQSIRHYYRNSIRTTPAGAGTLYKNDKTAVTTVGGNPVTYARIFGTTGAVEDSGKLRPVAGGIADKTETKLSANDISGDFSSLPDINTMNTDIENIARQAQVSYGALETPWVVPVSSITLPPSTSVPVGIPLSLSQMVTVSPTDAANKTVTWSSSDPTVATVSGGTVFPLKPGTTIITATANDGSGVYGTCEITVLPVLVESITLSGPETMKVGATAKVTATVLPANATNKTLEWDIWFDPALYTTAPATVDQSGNVTARAPGVVYIIARATDGSGEGTSHEITVTSSGTPVTKIALSGAPASMLKGATATITATITPTNATNKAVTWTSSNTSFATVDANGKVTAKGVGTVTITATAKDGSGVKATCQIKVTNPVTKIVLSGAPENMIKGNTATVKATVTPTDATDKAVTWSSSATAIATVSTSGVVTAKEPGTVTITATAKDGSGKKASATITVHSYVTLRLNKTKAIQNGIKTTIDDVGTKPFTISGKTMLPIRFVSEKLGAKVTFVSNTQPITVKYGAITVEFKLNSKQMKIIEGGKTTTITLEVAAQLVDGKTYIPLRALGQSLGFHIYYDADTEIIVVNNPDMTVAVRNERLAEGKAYIK